MDRSNINILFNWALKTRNHNLLFVLLHGIELRPNSSTDESLWNSEANYDLFMHSCIWSDILAHNSNLGLVDFADLQLNFDPEIFSKDNFIEENPVYSYKLFKLMAIKFRSTSFAEVGFSSRFQIIESMVDRYSNQVVIRHNPRFMLDSARSAGNLISTRIDTRGQLYQLSAIDINCYTDEPIAIFYAGDEYTTGLYDYLVCNNSQVLIQPEQEADVPINPLKRARQELESKNLNGTTKKIDVEYLL